MNNNQTIRLSRLLRVGPAMLTLALLATPAVSFAEKINMTTPPLYLFGASGAFVNHVTCTAGNSGTSALDIKVTVVFYNDDELASVNGMSQDAGSTKRTVRVKPGHVTKVEVPGGLNSLDSFVARCRITYDGSLGDVQGAIIVEDSLNARGAISLPARVTPF